MAPSIIHLLPTWCSCKRPVSCAPGSLATCAALSTLHAHDAGAVPRRFAPWSAAGRRGRVQRLRRGSDRPAMERAAMRHRAAVAAEARVTGIGGNLVAKSGKPIVEEDEELRVSAQVVRWSSEECRRARGRMAPVARPSIAGQGGARALRACLRLRALEPSGPDLCTQDCQDSGGALRCGARAGARGSGREMSLVQSRLDAGVSAKRAGQPRLPADVR
jgi:hypothetical protein